MTSYCFRLGALLLTLLLAAASGALPAGAQNLADYSFTSTSGTYATLPSGALALADNGDYDEGWYNGLPIGFAFTFRGRSYTTVSASTNGWLTFGRNITDAAYLNNLATGSTAALPLAAPLWDDLRFGNDGDFYYQTTGTAPNRVFTAEWYGARWNYTASSATIDFQVKLYEGTNEVQFVYRRVGGANSNLQNPSASIGLAGGGTDFLSLSDAGNTPSGSSLNATNTIGTKPTNGRIYSFLPGALRPPYGFEPTFTPYVPLTTPAASLSAGDSDDGTYNGLPIGFAFTFRGRSYTTVSASTNGWLTFGRTIADPAFGNSLSTGALATVPLAAPLWDDLDLAAGSFRTQLEGTAPNRVFTAEWRNALWDFQAATAAISFQVKLFEGTNRVWFVYRPEAGAVSNGSASVGLADAGYFLSLNGTGPAPAASTSLETSSLSAKPVLGQVYSFAPVPVAPLPVVLAGFTARRTGPATARLSWRTASEQHNEGFWVEKSADGRQWQALGFVAGAGTSSTGCSYAYPDNDAPTAAYYRLRQHDTDGTTRVSAAQYVAGAAAATALRVAPNPVAAGGTVQLVGAEAGALVRLLSGRGQLLREWPAGTTHLPVPPLAPGLYLLQAGSRTARLLVE